MRALRLSIALTALVASGCDTIGSDFSAFAESFNPPTPLKAAELAVDTNNPENQRRGIALLANAPWGGAEPYIKLYRLYILENTDPLVKAFSIRALGRHGDASDALLIAQQLTSPYTIVRFEAAKSCSRVHDLAVVDLVWPRLVDEREESEIRTEIAVALGQYPTDSVFQALVAAIDQRELAVNLAALDSLQTLTGQDFGLDQSKWLQWKKTTSKAFLNDERYLYPTYFRNKRFMDYILFWIPLNFENPGVPVGTASSGPRRTYQGEEQPSDEFKLPTLEKPEPVTPAKPSVGPTPPATGAKPASGNAKPATGSTGP